LGLSVEIKSGFVMDVLERRDSIGFEMGLSVTKKL
jgi:hypothetical protein